MKGSMSAANAVHVMMLGFSISEQQWFTDDSGIPAELSFVAVGSK